MLNIEPSACNARADIGFVLMIGGNDFDTLALY